MQLKSLSVFLLSIITLVASPVALAHTSGSHVNGLADGFMHVATGLDHLAIIIAAGYWAGRSGNHGISDLAFVLSMLLAGVLLGVCCQLFPGLQLSTILALIITAMFVAMMIAAPQYFAYLLFGGFALYHGVVHVLAMPATPVATGFVVGLFFSTALLLMGGLILRQVVVTRKPHPRTYSKL
jgi:urease accessory protein